MEQNTDNLHFRGRLAATLEHLTAAAQWREERARILHRFMEMLGPFPAHVEALSPETLSEERLHGYTRRKVSYVVEPDERITAWLLVPERVEGSAPAVLCLHGTTAVGKDQPAGLTGDPAMHTGPHLARRGYVVLVPDHITAGERIAPGLSAYDTAAFYARHPGWSAVGKMVWDAMRGLDYLLALPFVDGARLATIGVSLGGHDSVFTAALDERVSACVSICGWQPFAADWQKALDWSRDRSFIYFPTLRPHFLNHETPIDWDEILALLAPRPFLDISATNDVCFARAAVNPDVLAQIRRIYALFGAADHLDEMLHDEGHGFSAAARERAYAWLDRWLRQR